MKKTTLKTYKELLNYVAKYGITDCILEIGDSEMFNNIKITRITRQSYVVEE